MKSGLRAWTLAVLALLATGVRAHEMSIAELELRETTHGEFFWQWSATSDKRPATDDLIPRCLGDGKCRDGSAIA